MPLNTKRLDNVLDQLIELVKIPQDIVAGHLPLIKSISPQTMLRKESNIGYFNKNINRTSNSMLHASINTTKAKLSYHYQ